MAPKKTKGKPKLPRAPLPKQTETVHEDKKKRPFRKDKHKKQWQESGVSEHGIGRIIS